MSLRSLEERGKLLRMPEFWIYKCCCCYLPSLLLFLLIYIFVNYDPTCSIQNFYVPSINKLFMNTTTAAAVSDSTTVIFFDLELENPDLNYKGVRYDAVNLTFSYGHATTSMPIGKYTVAGFNQGNGKKAQRRDVALVTGGAPWEAAAVKAVSNGSTAIFKVDLDTEVAFKIFSWYSKKKRFVVGGMVAVDDSGKKVGKKPIELKSGAPSTLRGYGPALVTSLLVFFFL